MRLEMKYVILLMQTDLLSLTQENTRFIENVDVAYRFDWRDHGIDSVFWKR
jgi:hypothetical protein